jgi:exonuclease SbcC
MGAGKSSILQAITFALFGSLPEVKSRDVKVTELINRQAKETNIKLFFSKEQEYAILRNIDRKGAGNATVRDEQDQLIAGPKPTATTAFTNQLLKTDLDMFLRTVYAKQNEIDLFLKYTPSDRKKYIDELMKLNNFELARKHSTQLQNKIKVRLEESQKLLETTDKEKLATDINTLSLDITNLKESKQIASLHIEKASNNEAILKQQLAQLRIKKSNLDKLEQKLAMITSQIAQLKAKLKDTTLVGNKQEIISKITSLQSKLVELKTSKSKAQIDLEKLEERKLILERQLAVLASKERELASRSEEVTRLSKEASEITTQRPSLEDDLKLAKEKKEELTTSLQTKNIEVNNIIERLSELQTSDSCPVCTTELTKDVKKKLSDTRKRDIIALNKAKSELSAELASIEKELATMEELAKKLNDLRERIKIIEKAKEEIASALSEKESINKNKIELENTISTSKNNIKNSEETIENIQNNINSLTEKKVLYDSKEELDLLEKEGVNVRTNLSELSFDSNKLLLVENQYTGALRKVQELVSKQQNVDLLLIEKHKRYSDLVEQQSKLASLLENISKGGSKIEFLSKFNNALLVTQESLRVDLISTVNEVMSSIWSDLYPYDKWSNIRLLASESDYKLQLFDTEWVSVAGFASGGERMLAALALRIAFAKVLAPHLSLLILDEPTHNLDQKAIDTFLEILESKLSTYLDQVFIITHDLKLAEVGNVIEIK